MGENFGIVPSPGKRNMYTAEEGVLLSTGFTIRMEGKMKKFSLASSTLNILNEQEKNMNENPIVTSTASTTGNENQTRPSLYHYTAGWEKIVAILTTKVIFKEFEHYKGQATAVWLSANPVWENTVMKVKGGLEKHAEKLGAFRIKMKDSIPLLTWNDFVEKSGEKKQICRSMEMIGCKQGANPVEWYCSLDHIPMNRDTVESIGFFHDGKWDDLSVEEFKKKYSREISSVMIVPVPQDRVNKLQKKGYRLSPFFVDVLKRIQKNGRGESFMMIRIGNIIHCVLANA